MEALLGCLALLIIIAVSSAISCVVIYLAANYVVCPAFSLAHVSWLQALALSVVFGILSGYFNSRGSK